MPASNVNGFANGLPARRAPSVRVPERFPALILVALPNGNAPAARLLLRWAGDCPPLSRSSPTVRSFCLRVSGAVAPSAPGFRPVSPGGRQGPAFARPAEARLHPDGFTLGAAQRESIGLPVVRQFEIAKTQARFGSQLSPGFTPKSDAMRRTNANITAARKRVSATLKRPTPLRPGTAAFATKSSTSIH